MQIAVIGATGMLGRHAAQAVLNAGHRLVVIYRNPASLHRLSGLPQLEPRQADLTDRAALTRALIGVDGVINAAAYYPSEPKPWQEDVKAATEQAENFYVAAESARVARIVYLGGAIALPLRPDSAPADGTERYASAPASTNPYLRAKWAMDELALQKAGRGHPVVIAIPSMSFGEHDPGVTTGRFIHGIASGQVKQYVNGKRNVVYAGDAGRGLVLALERGLRGQRYLLTGSNTSMQELTGLIAQQAGMAPPRAVPLLAALALGRWQKARWRWFKGPLPEVSDTAIAVMSAGQHLDGSRSKAIGYEPQSGLPDTVARALAWFKHQRMC
jgi:dihydroflavonol-4-reductase